MLIASALPMPGVGCSNHRMLDGKELAKAIRGALNLMNECGAPKIGPTALGKGLGISQPSASQLLTTGRLSKSKLPRLLAFFKDVVGPDYFGLPYTKFEADFLDNLRKLPPAAQQRISEDVAAIAMKVDAAVSLVEVRLDEQPKAQPDPAPALRRKRRQRGK